MKTLVPLLGDQLSLEIASLKQVEKNTTVILITECREEATYVKHHKKKLVFVFSCMRHFAKTLRARGWQVEYHHISDTDCPASITESIDTAIDRFNCDRVVMTEAGEYRLQQSLIEYKKNSNIPFELLDDTRFICTHDEFSEWAKNRKQLRLENFYRDMRKQTGLLMQDNKPVGDQWNFDTENRKRPGKEIKFTAPLKIKPDSITKACIKDVQDLYQTHIGDCTDFWFAVTQKDADAALEHFINHSLVQFGDFQDAMLYDEPFLSHSVLALYMNIGLLDPIHACEKIQNAYKSGRAPLNSVEGFIRQIIGWREYVRGIYWLKMPKYIDSNYLNQHGTLPDFYWTGNTDMACLKASIEQTIDQAYAHHIQRLMITGNFAMLIGTDPKEVHEWYLAVYADAYEWVELPNTLGMSQFADGGLLGSKPYAASGNYINKMSNYCKQCRYTVSKKTGEDACPFNYLYWHFLMSNREQLATNHRLAHSYRTFEKMTAERKAEVRTDSESFLGKLSPGVA